MAQAFAPPNPKYDATRIADYPDKKTLAYLAAYFKTFVDPDPAAMRDFQTEDYTMTDIPLCIVNVNRDVWYQGNVAFVSMTTDTKVTALTVGGSVDSGYTVLENLVEFVLTMDPPPGPDRNLPPGAKKGDKCAMIMLSLLWWTPEGKIKREMEYGRLTWQTFTLAEFDRGTRFLSTGEKGQPGMVRSRL